MKKIIKSLLYLLIYSATFMLWVTIYSFIIGNTRVFDWDSHMRFGVVVMWFATICIITLILEMENIL